MYARITFTIQAFAWGQQGVPSRKTFRWALLALEFAQSVCRGGTLVSSDVPGGALGTLTNTVIKG